MSNIGYGILGALFLLAVVIKERSQLRKRIEEEGEPEAKEAVSKGWVSLSDLRKHGETSEQQTGTRIGYQLFYTMGITLIMIGFMSSCYHLCPTDVNFQFDTTYMYLLAILMAINLFKGRHPDLSPDVIAAFTILSFIVTVGVRLAKTLHIISIGDICLYGRMVASPENCVCVHLPLDAHHLRLCLVHARHEQPELLDPGAYTHEWFKKSEGMVACPHFKSLVSAF